jgi:hypothetical protein
MRIPTETTFTNPALTAKKRPTRQQPSGQPQPLPVLGGEAVAGKKPPKAKPPAKGGPLGGDTFHLERLPSYLRPTLTHNPVGPRPQNAPSAPGTQPPPNFGKPMPAAWKAAGTLVSEG